MKKLLVITMLALLGGTDPLRAQSITQIVQEQIEQRVKFPVKIGLPSEVWVKDLKLENLKIRMAFKSNGRVLPSSITFIGSYVELIKERLLSAVERVKIPADSVQGYDLITVNIRLAFENLNVSAATGYEMKDAPSYAMEPTKIISYAQSVQKEAGIMNYGTERASSDLNFKTYRPVGSRLRWLQFRVTIIPSSKL